MIFKTLLDNYLDYLFNPNGEGLFLTVSVCVFVIISVAMFVVFLWNEYKLITRKREGMSLLSEEVEDFKHDYDFKSFIGYNLELMFNTFGVILAFCLAYFLISLLIVLLLMVLLICEGVVRYINWWLIVPVIIYVLKYILYTVSLRYKK